VYGEKEKTDWGRRRYARFGSEYKGGWGSSKPSYRGHPGPRKSNPGIGKGSCSRKDSEKQSNLHKTGECG